MKKLKWEKTDAHEWKCYKTDGNGIYRIRKFTDCYSLRMNERDHTADIEFKRLRSAKQVAQLIHNG